MNLNNENKESSPIIETPKKSSVNKLVSLSTSIYSYTTLYSLVKLEVY